MKAAEDSLCHQPDDVLFSKLRPYLAKSVFASSAGTGTGELLVLRPTARLHPRYLFYLTLSRPWLDWAVMTSYGSKMPRTSWDAMGEYRAWFPSLDEQRRIAAFLDAETTRMDRIVELRARQRRLLDARFEAMADRTFAAFGSAAKTRLKFLLRQRPRYGVLVPEFVDDGVAFIRVNDLLDLRGRADDLRRIPPALSRQYSRTVVQTGDVLLSVVGTVGRAAIAPRELAGANVARAVCSIRVRPDVLPEFIVAWTATAGFKQQARLATGTDTAQPTLGMEDLANFELRWPSDHDEQVAAMSAFRVAASAIRNVDHSLERQQAVIKERRQALITAAVTGRFDVTTAREADLS